MEQAQDQTAESAAWSQKDPAIVVVDCVVVVVVFCLRDLRAIQELEPSTVAGMPAEAVAVLERMVVPSQQVPL